MKKHFSIEFSRLITEVRISASVFIHRFTFVEKIIFVFPFIFTLLLQSAAWAGWPQPSRLESWTDFDAVVAAGYNNLTNQALLYPPGDYWISIPVGRFLFAPEDELSGVTNLITPTKMYGVSTWQVTIVETVNVSRVWLYTGEGAALFYTNDAPASLDAEQWVDDAYTMGPPDYLTAKEIEVWYAERARDRFELSITLIASNDWPVLLAGLNAAVTNNPPAGAQPLTLPEDISRVAFASVQSLANAMEIALYTPVDKLPIDIFSRIALGSVTNGWSMRSTLYADAPFDTIQSPVFDSRGFYLAARADIDSDGDGIPDGREKFVLGTDPNKWDSAGLFFGDFLRIYVYGLDPLNRDTNGDGMDDDEAILNEYNPVTTTATPGNSSIRYYYDADDRLQSVYTTTSSGNGGGAAQYELSPSHNTISISARSQPLST